MQQTTYAYDEQRGPRTVSTLWVEAVYQGSHPGSTLQLATFGGPIPDGTFISSSAGSSFIVGARYVLFLTNEAWFESPLSTPALRVNEVSGREVLNDQEGHLLRGLGPQGLRIGAEQVFADISAPIIEQASAQPQLKVSPLALAGAFDRAELKRLLREAIVAEGVAPSGAFSESPTTMRKNWATVPTMPGKQ